MFDATIKSYGDPNCIVDFYIHYEGFNQVRDAAGYGIKQHRYVMSTYDQNTTSGFFMLEKGMKLRNVGVTLDGPLHHLIS